MQNVNKSFVIPNMKISSNN